MIFNWRPVASRVSRGRTGGRAAALALAMGLASCASNGPAKPDRAQERSAALPPLPPPPAHAGGGVLWDIARRCLAAAAAGGPPAPCAEIDSPPDSDGYVLLKDRVGASQYLLIPTVRITGVEDPATLEPGAAPLFAQAWRARVHVPRILGEAVADDWLSVAVNSAYGRSQDQLHFHIDCVRGDVRLELKALTARLAAGAWTPETVMLAGAPYYVRQLDESAFDQTNLFALVQSGLAGGSRDMAGWSLAVVGSGGAAKVFVLATRADLSRGLRGSSEGLQDHLCARAGS